MEKYIERGAFIEAVKDIPMWGSVAAMLADSIPAADVAPVVHGHRVDDGGFYARCSQCDGVLPLCANYCPNCGAKMDGGADNA